MSVTENHDVKLDKQDMTSATKLVKCVADCIWAIDTNHETIYKAIAYNKCKKLPALFKNIYETEYHEYHTMNTSARKRENPLFQE